MGEMFNNNDRGNVFSGRKIAAKLLPIVASRPAPPWRPTPTSYKLYLVSKTLTSTNDKDKWNKWDGNNQA